MLHSQCWTTQQRGRMTRRPRTDTFAAAADFFDRRAKRAFDGEAVRLAEVAAFYRTLATICVQRPDGAVLPKAQLVDRESRYRARAEECYALAEALNDDIARAMMLQVAQSYEQLLQSA